MNNKVIVRIMDDELMYDERLNILLEEACESIFPISIIHKDSIITACYSVIGYKRLSELKDLPALLTLSIVEKIIFAIEDCYQFLLFPDEYVVNSNTIYVSKNYDSVRITYITDKRRERIEKKLATLLRDLKKSTNEKDSQYLDMLIETCEAERISFTKMKMLIANLSQKLKDDNQFERELI